MFIVINNAESHLLAKSVEKTLNVMFESKRLRNVPSASHGNCSLREDGQKNQNLYFILSISPKLLNSNLLKRYKKRGRARERDERKI